MPFAYFDIGQITPLIISGILLLGSITLFKRQQNLSLVLLFIGTLGMGYFIANLDHFLILWDEQYHALVAKNLSKAPLTPTLFSEPVLDFDYESWTSNHIWLHKQPLFLWQMALSIKLFGTTELAIRIPSILMHAIMPLFIYGIGKAVLHKRTAYYGALLFAVAYFPLELVAGRYATDHNDVAFLFYVTASFWAWFEYEKSQKKHWLILIGLFSGCAVLIKWLMGLLVFVIWSITKTIVHSKDCFNIKSYRPMLYSAIIGLIVFLPWQIYISLAFPNESAYEYSFNTSHFFNPLEGHNEDTWFYFTDGLKKTYGSGDAIPLILLCGIVFLLMKVPKKTHKIGIASTIIFVYTFYTIAATKMLAFTIIVSPFIYLGMGHLIDYVISMTEKKIKHPIIIGCVSILIPLAVAFTALNLTKIQNYHTMWKPHDNHNRIGEQAEMEFINSLKENLPDDKYVIFNTSITVGGNIPIMFYTDHIAYDLIPTKTQIEIVREKNKKIAIIDLGDLPDYIKNDKDIIFLKY